MSVLLLESGSRVLQETGTDGLLLEGEVSPQRIGIREKPPLRLSIDVETPSGRHYRWAEDEPNPANVPGGLRFSSSAPGGFDSLDCTLPRKPGIDYPDLERLSTITVYGPGGDVRGEYRLERAPRTSGDQMAISPSASGWQAALEDNKSVRQVYVERDLSRLQEPSAQRRENLYAGGFSRVEAGGVEPDKTTGLPGLKLSIQGAQTAANFTVVEAWYDGLGDIGDVYYDPSVQGTTAAIFLQLGTSDDDLATGFAGTGDLYGPATPGYFTPGTPRRWILIQMVNQGTWTDEAERTASLRRLAFFGNHGLPKQGVAPNQGLWDSDVIAHAVGRWAPPIVTTSESIQAGSFVILNLAFVDPTTVAEIVKQASRFSLRDWFVWEKKTLWYHDRGAHGRNWRARIAPAQLEETGPQIDRLWSDVVVAYQDVDGTARTVGFPGSGADVEDASLHDADPENPANKLGTPRADLLQMQTATLGEATKVGAEFLQEQKLLDTSGQAQLVGHVQDDRGVWWPASAVRAGDTVSFPDAADTSPRRIVKPDYQHDTRTCRVALDSPPEGLQELLERLGVQLVSLGLS